MTKVPPLGEAVSPQYCGVGGGFLPPTTPHYCGAQH